MRSTALKKREFIDLSLRKVIHVMFCIVLLFPFIVDTESFLHLTILQFYLVLSLFSLAVNVLQVRRPLIKHELVNAMRRSREKILREIRELRVLKRVPLGVKLVEGFTELDKKIRMMEDSFYTQIDRMERSYEKIGGYMGITAGVIGTLFSYVFFTKYSFYGVLSLLVYDTSSSLFGFAAGKRKWPKTNKTVEGSVFGLLFFTTVLFFLTGLLLNSFLISLVAAVTEAYGVEDNLFLPVSTSLVAFFLKI